MSDSSRRSAAAHRAPKTLRAQARRSGRRSLPRGPLMFVGAIATVATLAGGGVYATTTLVSNTHPFSAGSTNVDAGCDTEVKVEERVAATSAQGTFPTSGAHLSDISADCDGQLLTVHALAADGTVIATQSSMASASGVVDITWSPAIADASTIDRHAVIIRPTDARIGTVTITGSPTLGSTLTARVDASLGRLSYQWQRSADGTNWTDIANATTDAYTPLDGDHGNRIRVVATSTTTRGATSATSGATAPVSGIAPSVASVTITGSAVTGQRLTASASGVSGAPAPTTAIRWQRSSDGTNWSDIANATAAGYTIADGDYGYRLRAVATATNAEGRAEATSTATGVVAGTSATIASASISGTTTVGQTLTASAGTTGGTPAPTVAYVWQRSSDGITGWADISGATSSTYVLVAADADKYVRVVATASNPVGSSSAASATSAKIAGTTPTIASASISGTTTVGQTLTATSGATTGIPSPTVSYKWQRSADGSTGWTDISGATSSTYVLVDADYNNYLRAVATASNAMGSASANSSASAKIAATTPSIASASISGTTTVGQTLTATSGATTGNPSPTVSYKWQRSSNGTSGWTDIAGATSSTYTLVAADYNNYVRAVATATNVAGSASANSSASAKVTGTAPTIASASFTGTTTVGQTLTATSGATTGNPSPTVTYKWQRSSNGTSWSNISGATSSTYTLVAADYNNYVRAVATATNVVGSASANSSASTKVAGSIPTLASVTINANVTIGQTITATAGATTGTPTPTVTYKWERSSNGTTWTTITGATSSSYTLVAADKDNKVRVTATATNSVGSDSKSATTAENIKL